MYLRFATELGFPEIAERLAPQTSMDALDWDSENVYEWMYLDMPSLEFSLNMSREHGWAKLDDELLDINSGLTEDNLRKLVTPGPTYVFGWNKASNDYVDPLPDWLAQQIAEKLVVDVFVFTQRINVDRPDPPPATVVFATSS